MFRIVVFTVTYFLLSLCLGCSAPQTETPLAESSRIIPETQMPVSKESKEGLFQTLVSIEDMNQSVKLFLSENSANDFRIGHSFTILIANTTEFVFVRLLKPTFYVFEEDAWHEIEDFTNYDVVQETIEPGGFSMLSGLPVPSKYDGPVEVRVVLTGDLVDENSNIVRLAGAYIDIMLQP